MLWAGIRKERSITSRGHCKLRGKKDTEEFKGLEGGREPNDI